jgi:hypothetical protein
MSNFIVSPDISYNDISLNIVFPPYQDIVIVNNQTQIQILSDTCQGLLTSILNIIQIPRTDYSNYANFSINYYNVGSTMNNYSYIIDSECIMVLTNTGYYYFNNISIPSFIFGYIQNYLIDLGYTVNSMDFLGHDGFNYMCIQILL